MIGDRSYEELVTSLSVNELEKKFFLLRTVQNATLEQDYYAESLGDLDVRWLGDSHWLVVFENGRATELRLMKG